MTKKVYQSKIGIELIIPVIIVFGGILLITVNKKTTWIEIVILLLVIFFIIHLFVATYYIIEGNKLTIKCGFIFTQTIDILTIKKISETNNPLSSPATSLDRLEIAFGKYDSILISPKHKHEFISDITSINSDIEVLYKKV
ncbi:hypothetical protein EMA8858_01045 [Emticicia aquatica]|uniref:Uncharacterized protein YyaB-like PH domain-containing protein n=1 Tax=Emticicia aquatica TaxID=1681835 RepID=A0ABN8EPT0_9BACT|nr:PH domain-containing protein [Emticicia aquatica]CAH0994930.1 hypothetical protein EMA8858_01045 [Emticicia aquatica]